MNVMIIDDEPKIRNGLNRLLQTRRGWKSAAFADARSALAYMYENEVHAIITDICMPGLSGLDMIEKIRLVNPDIPIIIISGYGRFDYAQRAIELGVRKYITKPTAPDEILNALEQVEAEIAAQVQDMQKRVGEERKEAPVGNLLILRAVEYMEKNYQSKLALKEVAGALYISPNYLSELFKKTTGVRFSDYLLDLRMEKSKDYLADISYRINDITRLVGFSDARYFSSSFKKKYGMTPMEYRNRHIAGSEKDI